jgi:hypothetical protein
MSKAQINEDIDFSKRFIINQQFPVYKYESLTPVIDNPIWSVQKFAAFVDGNIVWTYFLITIKPGKASDPYQIDSDTKLGVIEGSAWLMISHKGQHGSRMIEGGDMVIIPENATYNLLNLSKTENIIYSLDSNTFQQIQ